jgi:hypothetical protein
LALKTQTFIFALIVLALVSFWFGSPITDFTGPNISEPAQFDFWMVFAVFFPAVTGIEAGISMSGDLKNPRTALPFGTLAAVFVGLAVYIFSAVMLNELATPAELINNPLILTKVAAVPFLIYLGLWGATLSSTMGALLGAPRTLQALAQDRIVPQFLAKGAPKTNDPQRATVFSIIIAVFGIYIGDLNTIASVLSMFFLTSYGALNLVAGLEGLIDNPSWRPTFRVSWLISLAGAFLCFGAMFMIDSGSSFIALGSVALVFYITKKRKLKSNYSDIRSGLALYFARQFLYSLNRTKKNVRNWRPNFLVFSGSPKSRLHLIQLADAIGHRRGFLTVASILTSVSYDQDKLDKFDSANSDFLEKNKITALTKTICSTDFKTSVLNMADFYGLGGVTPNTLIFGDSSNPENLDDHVEIIKSIFNRGKNVIVIKDSNETKKKAKVGGQIIDLWWGGKGANRSLMLAFAHMLSTSRMWDGSKVRINSIVKNEEAKQGVANSLKEFLTTSRLRAEFQIVVAEPKDYKTIMTDISKKADVTFFGLQNPLENENYKDYYVQMMDAASNLQTTVFVLAAEKISFEEIFD